MERRSEVSVDVALPTLPEDVERQGECTCLCYTLDSDTLGSELQSYLFTRHFFTSSDSRVDTTLTWLQRCNER